MNISYELAQPIVNRLRSVLDCPISITNERGVIIASNDDARLGSKHEVALKAITNRHNESVSREAAETYDFTYEGMTLPLTLHGSCVGALCLRGNPEELKLYASIISIAVISLLESAEISQQDNERRRLSDAWIKSLISDSVSNLDQIEEKARVLGIDCQRHCAILVIRFKPITYSQLPAIETAITEVTQTGPGLQFVSYIGQGQFVCAVPVPDTDYEEILHKTCNEIAAKLGSLWIQYHIGVGRPSKGIKGYRLSYQDAFHSARVSEELGETKSILFYDEHHIFRLLESIPKSYREIFIANQMGDREWDPVLLETLRVYFMMDCQVNKASKALYIHRNTLLFRLNKISETFGLDPRKFHDSMILRVLLYLMQLSEPEEID